MGRSRGIRVAAAVLTLLAMLGASAVVAFGSSPGASPAAATPSVVRIGFPSPIVTLDTDLAVDPLCYILIHLVGATLTTENSSGQILPGLASKWTISSNRLTYTFTLRPGLKFSTGAPLTSSDVKATFDWMIADKASVQLALVAPIASVAAPSPSTVVITLKHPYTSLLTYLQEPEFSIYPKSGLADPKKFFNKPISAGPYVLGSLGGGNNPTLVRNPNYYGPQPAVQTLEFKLIVDPATRLDELLSGQVDIAHDLPSTLLPEISGSKAHVTFVNIFGFIGFFTQNKPGSVLSNVRVRQAINLAVNRSQLSQIVWDGKLTSIAGFWPSIMAGYDPKISTAQNLPAAKALLKGTGCQHGCTITVDTTPSISWTDSTAVVLSQDLQQIGITLKIVPLENAQYYTDLANGTYQSVIGFLYDFANAPDALLVFGLQSAPYNAQGTHYQSAQMDALIHTAVTAQGAQRAAALSAIQVLFEKDRPYVTLSDYPVISASTLPKGLVELNGGELYNVAAK